MVDYLDAVFEVDDTNNIAVGTSVISIAAPDWNLNASNISAGSSTIQTGDSVQLQLTVTNTGTVAISGCYLEFYLSSDTSITTSDTVFCFQDRGELPAGTIDTFAIACTAPTVTAGTYYFGAIVDPGGALAETDENDNVAVYDLMTIDVVE